MLHVSACQRLVGLLSEESLNTLNTLSNPNTLNTLSNPKTQNTLNAFLLLKRLRKN